jgi:hypothetical protein
MAARTAGVVSASWDMPTAPPRLHGPGGGETGTAAAVVAVRPSSNRVNNRSGSSQPPPMQQPPSTLNHRSASQSTVHSRTATPLSRFGEVKRTSPVPPLPLPPRYVSPVREMRKVSPLPSPAAAPTRAPVIGGPRRRLRSPANPTTRYLLSPPFDPSALLERSRLFVDRRSNSIVLSPETTPRREWDAGLVSTRSVSPATTRGGVADDDAYAMYVEQWDTSNFRPHRIVIRRARNPLFFDV